MNRRNFLKAFTGAAVGAAVLYVAPPMPEVVAAAVKSPLTQYGTLEEVLKYYEAEMMKRAFATPFLDAIRAAADRSTATSVRYMQSQFLLHSP